MSRGSSYPKLDDRVFLNSPWVCLQPADFGIYSGDLLVGNFGDGTIVAFHTAAHRAIDYLRDTHGYVISIYGLWDCNFGNGASLGCRMRFISLQDRMGKRKASLAESKFRPFRASNLRGVCCRAHNFGWIARRRGRSS